MRGTDFAELVAFAAVAERRSFARAAVQLGLAVSTVSHRMRELEERLGVRLLNRTTRAVAPTAAGDRLLAQLRPALQGLESAMRALDAWRTRPAGSLRLTVPPPAAATVIAPLLARFAAAYPEIALEVSVDGTPVDIVRAGFDAGIRIGELVARDMIAVPVGRVDPVVVGSPDYIARRGRPRNPAELAAHNCIRVRIPGGGLLPWRFRRNGRAVEAVVRGTLTVNDRELELRAALDGVGLAYLPEERAAAALADGRLVALLQDWMPKGMRFHLYYPSRRQMPLPLRAFVDFVRAEAGGRRRKRG